MEASFRQHISVEDRNNMRQGWIESFDKLSDYLKELGAGSMKDMKTRI